MVDVLRLLSVAIPVQFVQVTISAFSHTLLQTVCTLADFLLERLGRLSPKSPFKYAMLRNKDSGETFFK